MKDDRLRVSVGSEYTAAIGLAAYCFANLEWAVVHCGEKLVPGFGRRVRRKTAGEIGDCVTAMAPLVQEADRSRFVEAMKEFARLTKRRNDLLHANPATVAEQPRLVRKGTAWQLHQINDLADEFASCFIELNDFYYNVLGGPMRGTDEVSQPA